MPDSAELRVIGSVQRHVMPAGNEPFALASCDLDRNCKPDLINLNVTDLATGYIRITYNTGILESYCGMPGDFNDDGMVNGCDIQDSYGSGCPDGPNCITRGFVDTYFDPESATPHDQCAADLTLDGQIDIDDLDCMVATLLGDTCGPCALLEVSHSPIAMAHGFSSVEQSSTPFSREPLIEIALVWLAENPRHQYPLFTDQEWLEMCIEYFESINLFD